jgi:hypothetical protein
MAVIAEGARRKERILCLFDVDGTLTPARQVGPRVLPREYHKDSQRKVWGLQRCDRGHSVGCIGSGLWHP